MPFHGRVKKSWIWFYLKSMEKGNGFIGSIRFVTLGIPFHLHAHSDLWMKKCFIHLLLVLFSIEFSAIFTAGLEQFIDISRWKNLLTFQKQNIESINMILYGIISKSFIDWLNDYICSATGDDNSQNYGILGATTTWTSPSTHKFQYSRLSWSYISE